NSGPRLWHPLDAASSLPVETPLVEDSRSVIPGSCYDAFSIRCHGDNRSRAEASILWGLTRTSPDHLLRVIFRAEARSVVLMLSSDGSSAHHFIPINDMAGRLQLACKCLLPSAVVVHFLPNHSREFARYFHEPPFQSADLAASKLADEIAELQNHVLSRT